MAGKGSFVGLRSVPPVRSDGPAQRVRDGGRAVRPHAGGGGPRLLLGLGRRTPLLRLRHLPLPGDRARRRGPDHEADAARHRHRRPAVPQPDPRRRGARLRRPDQRWAPRRRLRPRLPTARDRRVRHRPAAHPLDRQRGDGGDPPGVDAGRGELPRRALPVRGLGRVAQAVPAAPSADVHRVAQPGDVRARRQGGRQPAVHADVPADGGHPPPDQRVQGGDRCARPGPRVQTHRRARA